LQAREDLLREAKKKEEESKIKLQMEKEAEIQYKTESKKQKELVNGLKYTFDCNGAQIQIKQFPIERLPNDFQIGR
jgi:hypothetical protein